VIHPTEGPEDRGSQVRIQASVFAKALKLLILVTKDKDMK
jgi:hypothetical protein